jgi:hypothetical protein
VVHNENCRKIPLASGAAVCYIPLLEMAAFSLFSMLSGPNGQNGMENAAQGSVLGRFGWPDFALGRQERARPAGRKYVQKK